MNQLNGPIQELPRLFPWACCLHLPSQKSIFLGAFGIACCLEFLSEALFASFHHVHIFGGSPKKICPFTLASIREAL